MVNMGIKSKILPVLVIVGVIAIISVLGYSISKKTQVEKKLCKKAMKECNNKISIEKKEAYKKCIRNRIECGKKNYPKILCRKEARECISRTLNESSIKGKECRIAYKKCLNKSPASPHPN